MKQFFYLSTFLLLFASASFAQVIVDSSETAENFDKTVYGLGVAVGPVSGVGLSFRDHFPSRFSFQLVTGIIKANSDLLFSMGAELQYDLARGQTTRLYVFPGLAYFYQGTDSNTFESPFRGGAGVGVEFKAQGSLSFSLEGVFTFYEGGKIIPLPQASAHYYFY